MTGNRPAAAVTIGVFDGVHLGHQALVARVRHHADQADLLAVIFTFAEHPLATLAPSRCPPALTTTAERQTWLTAAGAERVHVLVFDEHLAASSAADFLAEHIVSRYDLTTLVVGPDFAMGRDRAGDLATLRGLAQAQGFRVDEVAVVPVGGAPISSSRIRIALSAGRVEEAATLLGRPYAVTGPVIRGHGRGRKLGVPTANLEPPAGKLVPATGVYAGVAVHPLIGHRLAAINVGLAPTFGGTERRVEVHILDFDGEWVGQTLEVQFGARLREERRFADAEALVAQIHADLDRVRRLAPKLGVEVPEADR